MKHEWKKVEKEIYLPKNKPTIIEIPKFKYFTVTGEGNPNSDSFSEAVGALYAVSYGVRMSPKKGIAPDGYFEYTVYPLEGFWSLNEEGIKQFQQDGVLNKDNLTFKIMIRQPDFVTDEFALETIKRVSVNKPNLYPNLYNEGIKFEEIEEGLCLQMLHVGPYDTEPESFQKMQEFCDEFCYRRMSPNHKEVYISDPRKSAPEKNKTVLRFTIEKIA